MPSRYTNVHPAQPDLTNSVRHKTDMPTVHKPADSGEQVLTFREAEVSQEVRSLSTGRARGLQLENGCSEGANPPGFEWDFGHRWGGGHIH